MEDEKEEWNKDDNEFEVLGQVEQMKLPFTNMGSHSEEQIQKI